MRWSAAGAGVAVVIAAACGSTTPEATPAPVSPVRPVEPVSDPIEYRIPKVSREAGEAIFTRTGIGDPYRTGMAYPVFLALQRAYPEELGANHKAMAAKFGFTPRDANPRSKDLDVREGLPVGMHLTTDPNTGVAWIVGNCTLCHAERLRWPGGEKLIVGLGNKRIRVHAYDAAIARVTEKPGFGREKLGELAAREAEARGLAWPFDWQRAILDASIEGLRKRARGRADLHRRVANGPPGRVAAIEVFAQAFADELGHPVPTPPTVGWTKVPDVIGFPVRTTLSWDGAGQGSIDALVVEADFAAGARPQWFWDHPLQGPSLSAFLRQQPARPSFPGKIDRTRAKKGQALFEYHCSPCHGKYAADGKVVTYEEQVVEVDDVGTDPARAFAISDEFVKAANTPELTHGIVSTKRTGGYVPPVLTNVWARAPYGHLGQWPTLTFLATRPDRRPTRYAVDLDAPLDLEAVGVRVVPESTRGAYIHDGTQAGLGVGGHPFLADVGDNAPLVIEYLKTL